MKRLSIFTILAILAMGTCMNTTTARAEEDHIKLSKKITPVGDSKTDYMITLETYVTGTQVNTVTTTTKPVDIVLSLDISSSMYRNTVSGSGTTTYNKQQPSASYSYNDLNNKTLYIKVGENYYQIKRNSYETSNGTTYWLQYDNQHHIGQQQTSADAVLYDGNGDLYTKKGQSYTKYTESLTYNTFKDNTYYYDTGNIKNRWKPVSRKSQETKTQHYYLYYTIGDTNYYLSNNEVVTDIPSTYTDGATKIWTGELYTATSSGDRKRIDVLDEAVKAFIDQIAVNAAGPDGDPNTVNDNVSNRICIIGWDKHEHYITGNSTNYTTSKTDSNYGNNFIDVLNDDKTVSEANITTLKSYVDGLVAMCKSDGEGTRQDRGILAARNCINAIDATRKAESNQVVVMFTDGEPYANSEKITDAEPYDQDQTDATHPYTYKELCGTDNTNRRRVVYLAMDYGKPMKDAGIPIFSVAMGITSDTYKSWMDWISSNYPDAVRENPGTKITIKEGESGYFFDSKEGNNLTQIFEAIAKKTSTDGDVVELNSSSTAVVDVVSDNFLIPTGADLSTMKVWVESYYLDSEGVGKWAKKGEANYYYAGPELQIQLGSTDDAPFVEGSTTERVKNKLTVTNFNYGLADEWNDDGSIKTKGNWVGKRGTEDNPQYWGNKVVITFPVKLNKDYEGGYQMPSNDIKSGIYIPDPNDPTKMVQLRAYPVPSVDFPSLCIVKDGLQVGESAIFEVYKGSSTTPLYTFTLIQREKSKNDHNPGPCYMIIKRLDAGEYTVKEKTNWTWLYSTETTSIKHSVIAANQLGVTLSDFTETGSKAETLLNNGDALGLELNPHDVDETNPNLPLCIIADISEEISGNAISILYHFTNTRDTAGKPGRAESYSHNEFYGGKTQGGTETGGNEEEDI